jgi:hypothetical protein
MPLCLRGCRFRQLVTVNRFASHGRGPLGRFWFFGSVGDALMRRLSAPLLFVREQRLLSATEWANRSLVTKTCQNLARLMSPLL